METPWTLEIKPQQNPFNLRLKEVWQYRDLILMFVKRDFVTFYKQTILGPLWFFLQPILTMLVFVVIFGNIANIPTDGLPKPIFYLCGIIAWNYFSECLTSTSSVFITNAQLFGKIYFPRIIIPLSKVISNLIRFGIQFTLFFGLLIYYAIVSDAIKPNFYILLTPLLLLNMAALGLGLGMIVSAMTTKYKDLVFLISFGVQLLMYATPVIIPLSEVAYPYRYVMLANPMTSIIEAFRYGFLGVGSFNIFEIAYSFIASCLFFFAGLFVFNTIEKSFTDVI